MPEEKTLSEQSVILGWGEKAAARGQERAGCFFRWEISSPRFFLA
jgi:hypothetical protein